MTTKRTQTIKDEIIAAFGETVRADLDRLDAAQLQVMLTIARESAELDRKERREQRLDRIRRRT